VVVFYGARNYGSVDACGGEHAQTQFFHVYWLPLVPTGSSWVTGPRPDGTNAHGIKLYGKSVLSGYLRVWGPIVAIGNLIAGLDTGRVGHLIVAAIAVVLAAWSWSTRTLRGAQAQRRSDFNYVAFGTRCEPKRMLPAHRAACKKQLDERWRELAPRRSPNEIAQHGADGAAEAVLAYGLLRLSSLDRGGAADAEGADRILAGRFDAPSSEDGPYRAKPAAASDAATGAALAELVARRAEESRAIAQPTEVAATIDPVAERKRLRRKGRVQLAGLVFMTLVSAGAALALVSSLRPAVDVTLSQLRGVNPPMDRTVAVTCDAVDAPIWDVKQGSGTVARIAMCHLGKYLLPLKLGEHDSVPSGRITGRLRDIDDRLVWVTDGLRRDPELEMHTLDFYLDTNTLGLGEAALGLGILVATLVLWILWFRARARRRRLATSS